MPPKAGRVIVAAPPVSVPVVQVGPDCRRPAAGWSPVVPSGRPLRSLAVTCTTGARLLVEDGAVRVTAGAAVSTVTT